uniref:Uncharacterized protein n=1 Tax=Rhizophagus irregularis (strain DAOM 181602 / DAOM 197198 / MUCL 43194) TaxID=747089 RepID=U9SXF2_RHIID
MGKNCGYSSSEGLFAVDSLIEDIVKSYTVSAFNIQGKFSCDVLSRITLPYTSGQGRVGQKLRLFSLRAPVVTCHIEGDALTDHSEELLLPHQP